MTSGDEPAACTDSSSSAPDPVNDSVCLAGFGLSEISEIMSSPASILGLEEAPPRRLFPPITLSPHRDSAVDVIKGVACLLMVAAHVSFAHAPWLDEATMGAVLFFASTGMNLAGVVERRPGDEKKLAWNAIFLIFAGFANNYVQGTGWSCDVFQIAGLSMLAMLGLRRILPRSWTWLFPLPFLLLFANEHLHWKTTAGGLASFFLAPGLFPLIPWLSFYLLGAHLRRYQNIRLGWAIGAASLAGVGMIWLFRPFRFDKWWMSPDYFLLGCVAASWWWASLRRWLTASWSARLIEIRFWGANSLVFYILHNFVLRVLEMAMLQGIALFLLTTAITAVLLRPSLMLQAWAGRQRPAMVLYTGILVSAAVLMFNADIWPGSFPLRTLASFGLTFSFIACYPAWKNFSRPSKPQPQFLTLQLSGKAQA